MTIPTQKIIDLRSDTVTQPSPGMRQAMANADVGDDVLGEDPTVNRLQERAALLLGKEAALFVPSGSMANQIALKVHCEPGDDVLVGNGSHIYFHEAGAGGAIAGVQFTVLEGNGKFSAEAVLASAKRPSPTYTVVATRLLCVENTHNRGGGAAWTMQEILAVATVARSLNMAMHLDGARLLNAAVATGVPAAKLAAPFDTATLCFSKGLGAPVGSVIAGNRAHIDRARRFRKMLGGGMRQAGVLAAAALWALDQNVARLAEDHTNARAIAERLHAVPGLSVDPARVETNIVLVDLDPRLPPAAELAERLLHQGVLVLPFGARRLRLCTHLDVTRADCLAATEILAAALPVL